MVCGRVRIVLKLHLVILVVWIRVAYFQHRLVLKRGAYAVKLAHVPFPHQLFGPASLVSKNLREAVVCAQPTHYVEGQGVAGVALVGRRLAAILSSVDDEGVD